MTDAFQVLESLSKQGKLLFGLIQKKGPITRNEIMDITKMKLTTLKRFMQPLIDNDLVIEAAVGESTGGRPPVLYDINPDGYYAIGIDISRTYMQIVLANLKMGIIDQMHFSAPPSPEEAVRLIYSYVYETLERLSIDKSRVCGIGIGTVGPLDRKRGIILNPKDFTAGNWVNVPLKDMVEQKLQLPVIVDNGANTAALAEYYFGSGKGLENIAYFNCGVGIRTGVITSGTIVRTINDAEDAFGHMVVDVDGDLCSCGNYGCVECYSSIPSITKRFKSELKKGRPSSVMKPYEGINYADTCAAAEENDELAREVIINAATIFGAGLANYINLLNPGLVILSGPLIKHSKLFYETAASVSSKRRYLKEGNKITYSRGGYFGDNAIAAGAAVELIEEMIK